ncbi:AarF/UbiB family protein [Bradyrhizobium barranii]|uniref:AarF/UbiB family protein n=1 Tax=Bradyrhizobium barranii TaxID=2992140 RepID=A0ABY3QXU4_9BRAD|nr:AarF/UbiB family protein [Bradyrhizobium japonicum]UFW90545.1 AarF/UbiB family protein [Bradyrhizobium japonicum]
MRTSERLGPVFVKLAQMMSYRADIFPTDFLAPLMSLQEHVEPLAPGKAQQAFADAIGVSPSSVFASFDDSAIASGTIATVHRATTRNGELVVVKIVRPGVVEAIDTDLACMKRFVQLIARRRFASGIPVVEVFETFSDMLRAQCDMIIEAQNLRTLAENSRGAHKVLVPTARTELVASPQVLVMDFISNTTPITDLDLDRQLFRCCALRLLRTVYEMIFVHGFVHGDLHPGNVQVRPDGTIYLFDAGLTASLNSADRKSFATFFLSFVNSDSPSVAAAIVESAGDTPPHLDYCSLGQDVEELVKQHAGRNASEFLVAGFVYQVFAIQRRHRLYGAPGFVAAIWALMMFEGLVRSDFPELDFQQEARCLLPFHLHSPDTSEMPFAD